MPVVAVVYILIFISISRYKKKLVKMIRFITAFLRLVVVVS